MEETNLFISFARSKCAAIEQIHRIINKITLVVVEKYNTAGLVTFRRLSKNNGFLIRATNHV